MPGIVTIQLLDESCVSSPNVVDPPAHPTRLEPNSGGCAVGVPPER
jgi:hypothetical protein